MPISVTGGGAGLTYMGKLTDVYPNEVQTLTVSAGAAADTFDLTFNTHESTVAVTVPGGGISAITAAQVQSCIDSISDFVTYQPTVAGSAGGPFTITFDEGTLVGTDQGAITMTSKTGTADGSIAETQKGGLPYTDETPTFTTLTGGAANTKGDYAAVVRSTASAATMMRVKFENSFTTGTQINQLVDIATGAAGAESVLVANIQAGSAPAHLTSFTPGYDLWFPVNIAAGTRISARMQDAVGADTVGIHISLYGGGLPAGGVDTMGATTASSKGTEVTAGLNSYGNWTEIEDSTTAAYRYVIPSIQTGEIAWSGIDGLLQVGTGANPNESAILTIPFTFTSTEYVADFRVQPVMNISSIPAGTRLSCRIWGGIAADIFQVAFHGVK